MKRQAGRALTSFVLILLVLGSMLMLLMVVDSPKTIGITSTAGASASASPSGSSHPLVAAALPSPTKSSAGKKTGQKPKPTPTPTPIVWPSLPTFYPTASPTPTPNPTSSPAPTPTPSAGPTATPTPAPTATPTPAPTPAPTPTPTPAPTPTPTPAPASGLTATALNSYSSQLVWAVPATANRVQIYRNARLIDDFSFAGGSTLTYTDYLLWQSSAYSYDVKLWNGGSLIADQTASITTPAQSGSFPRLYGSTSFWNQPIAANPAIDPNSANMIASSLTAYAGSANFAPTNDWGKALAYANVVSTLYSVGCTLYDCGTSITFHIPSYAQPTTGSDHHLIVITPGTNSELDMWEAAPAWSAGSRYLTNPTGWGADCAQGQHCDGAVAAGYAAFGGVVRPEEIAQGHIDHALFFTTPYTRAGYIACPATHTDGVANDANALPEGARIQLDPSFNVDAQSWPRWEKVIAHALQTYGAYLGDTGGSISFPGEANINRGYDAWSLAGVSGSSQSLANLPWSSFRVLQIQGC